MSRRHAMALAALSVLGALSCEQKPAAELPLPKVALDLAEGPNVEVGAPFTVELRVTNPDGSPSTRADLKVTWPTNSNPPTVVEESNPSPGVYRLTVVHQQPEWRYLTGRVSIFNSSGVHQYSADTKLLVYRVWGGATTALSVLDEKAPGVSLVVGEKRPLLALPTAPWAYLPSLTLLTTASTPVTWRTGSPDVATVSAAGEVTALAVGATTVTATSGSSSVDFPVTVLGGPVAPPPPGFSHLALPNPSGLTVFGDKDSYTQRAAIDSKGWPAFVLLLDKPEPGRVREAVLVRWTGSGWGVERVSPPWAQVGEARLAIDEHDRLFVAMLIADERQQFLVAERHALGPSGEWRLAVLPVDLRIPQALGLDRIAFGRGQRHVSVRARPGGGVWLGLDAIAEFDNPTLEQHQGTGLLLDTCLQAWTLQSLTDAGVKAVKEKDFFFPRPQGGCPDGARDLALGIRPLPDGGAELDGTLDVPFQVSARWGQQAGPDGGRLPGLDGWTLQRDRQEEIVELDDRLLYLQNFGVSAFAAPGTFWNEDSNDAWSDGVSTDLASTWARTARGRTVVNVFREVTTAGLLAVGIGISRVPPLPDFLGDDSTGARLYPGAADPPPPFERPLVLASGTRLVVGYPRKALGDVGGIDRSVARGPFTRVKEFSAAFSAEWPLASDGVDVYAVGAGTGGTAVSRSTDEGKTWQGLVGFPLVSSTGQLEVFSTTAALATSGGRLYFSPGLVARQGFTENTSTPTGKFIDTSRPMGLYRLPGDRVAVAALVNTPAPVASSVWWRVFDPTGAVVTEWTAPCSRGQALTEGAPLADGSVLLVDPLVGTRSARVMRAASGGAPVTEAAIPSRAWVRLLAARLTDGRVVFGGEYLDGRRSVAAWFSTADGVTFSAATPLRPLGGNAQTVYGLAAEGTAVGVVVGDNGSVIGRRQPIEAFAADRRWANLAPLVPLWHRVVVP